MCGGFNGMVGVRGNRTDQGEGVGHRAERGSPRSTPQRGSSSLNCSRADVTIDPDKNWHCCDCDYVSLLGVEVSDHETRGLGCGGWA